MDELKLEKRALRRELRQRIAAMTEKELEISNEAIYNNLNTLPELREAERVFFYLSVGHEIDTRRLLRDFLLEGRKAALPVSLPGGIMYFAEYRPENLQDGTTVPIPEPGPDAPRMEPEDGDVILVPALTFDRNGYRLGQGGGYYDRFLSGRRLFSVGLGREALLPDSVPREPHDFPVQCLVTERGAFRFSTDTGSRSADRCL